MIKVKVVEVWGCPSDSATSVRSVLVQRKSDENKFIKNRQFEFEFNNGDHTRKEYKDDVLCLVDEELTENQHRILHKEFEDEFIVDGKTMVVLNTKT